MLIRNIKKDIKNEQTAIAVESIKYLPVFHRM